jgi:hypothetical protein
LASFEPPIADSVLRWFCNSSVSVCKAFARLPTPKTIVQEDRDGNQHLAEGKSAQGMSYSQSVQSYIDVKLLLLFSTFKLAIQSSCVA